MKNEIKPRDYIVGRIGEVVFARLAFLAKYKVKHIGQEWKDGEAGNPDFLITKKKNELKVEVKVSMGKTFDFTELTKKEVKPDYLVVFHLNKCLYICCFKHVEKTNEWRYYNQAQEEQSAHLKQPLGDVNPISLEKYLQISCFDNERKTTVDVATKMLLAMPKP